jgi:hypothetical protein
MRIPLTATATGAPAANAHGSDPSRDREGAVAGRVIETGDRMAAGRPLADARGSDWSRDREVAVDDPRTGTREADRCASC